MRGVSVEALDGVLARLLRRGAVDGAVVPAAEEAVVLQQVQRLALTGPRHAHLHELHEHQHTVAAGNQLLQHGVEHGELGGLRDGGLVGDVLPAAADLLVDVAGMADELTDDLHAEVARGRVKLQVAREDELLVASVLGADDVVPAGQHRPRDVQLALARSHAAVDDDLLLGGQVDVDVSLDAAQEKGRDDLAQRVHDVRLDGV